MSNQSVEGEEKEEVTNSLGSVVQGASFFAAGYIVDNVFKYVTNILLSRLFGAAGYGIFVYAKTALQISLLVSDLGSTKSLMRYLPAYEDDRQAQESTLTLALLSSSASALLTGVLVIMFAPMVSQYTIDTAVFIDVLRLFGVIIIFDTLIKVIAAIFQALELAQFDVLIRKIVRPGGVLVAAAVGFVAGLQIFDVVALMLVMSGLTLSFAIGLALRYLDLRPSKTIENIDAQSYFSYSLPVALKDVGWFFYMRVDLLMVGVFFSATSVGMYNAAILLAAIIPLPLTALSQLYPPVASRLYNQGDLEELETVYKTVSRWSLTASLPLAIGAILYGQELLWMFGEEFVTGATILTVLALAKIADGATGPTGYTLMMTDHQYLLLLNQWSFALLNVGLNYLLILEFGVIGAAYSSAITISALNLVRAGEVWYFEGMHPFSGGYLKPLTAAIPAAVTMVLGRSLLPGHPVIVMFTTGALGCLAYVGALYSLGFEEADRDLARKIRG